MQNPPTEDGEVDKVQLPESIADRLRNFFATRATFFLATVSFLESALPLPILTDPFLAAAVLNQRLKTTRFVVVATVSSVLGGAAAYFSASFFLEKLLNFLSPVLVHEFENLLTNQDSGVFILTLLGAMTPVPYTLVAWAVEVLHGSIIVFLLASFIGRGLRYAIVGYLTYRFGPQAIAYSRSSLRIISVGLVCLAIAYFLLRM